MTPFFRNVALGIILLAVIVTAATSCRKQAAEVKKLEVEPWPVVSVLEWCEGPQVPAGCSLILFSDRRLIIRRMPQEGFTKAKPTFWMRVLSQEEFEKVDEAANQVMRTSLQRSSYEFGTFVEYGSTSSLYFGLPGKGMIVDVEGVHLLSLEKNAPSDFARLLDYNQLSDELRRYWKVLLEVMDGDFEPWSPTEILFEFFPSQTQGIGGSSWPSDWPQPNLSKGGNADSDKGTCVKMTINRLDQVLKLFRGKGQGEFIEMNVAGLKRLVSYQFQYPGEDVWYQFHAPPGIVDLDSFMQPVEVKKPIVPKPVPPKRVDLK